MTLAVELVLAGLLAAAIGAMAVLLRRLNELRDGKATFDLLLAQLGEASSRAQAAGTELKKSAQSGEEKLGALVKRAQALNDDLQFLTERGEKLAEELGAAARAARSQPAPAARPQPALAARASEPVKREERPLPSALAGLR